MDTVLAPEPAVARSNPSVQVIELKLWAQSGASPGRGVESSNIEPQNRVSIQIPTQHGALRRIRSWLLAEVARQRAKRSIHKEMV